MDKAQLSEIITQVLNRLSSEEFKTIKKVRTLVISEDIQNGLSIFEDFKQFMESGNISLLTTGNDVGIATPKGFERIFVIEDLPSDCNEWIKQFEKVLIPNPSLKIVSKIAHVILDDKFTEIIFSALQEGKQVMIGQTSHNEKVKNFKAPLRIEIQRITDKLKDYGIEQMSEYKSQKNCSTMTKDIINKTRGVISLNDITQMIIKGNELSVSVDTIITPLAMDYIRDKKISLNREG